MKGNNIIFALCSRDNNCRHIRQNLAGIAQTIVCRTIDIQYEVLSYWHNTCNHLLMLAPKIIKFIYSNALIKEKIEL